MRKKPVNGKEKRSEIGAFLVTPEGTALMAQYGGRATLAERFGVRKGFLAVVVQELRSRAAIAGKRDATNKIAAFLATAEGLALMAQYGGQKQIAARFGVVTSFLSVVIANLRASGALPGIRVGTSRSAKCRAAARARARAAHPGSEPGIVETSDDGGDQGEQVQAMTATHVHNSGRGEPSPNAALEGIEEDVEGENFEAWQARIAPHVERAMAERAALVQAQMAQPSAPAQRGMPRTASYRRRPVTTREGALAALEAAGGNKSKAAKSLGVSLPTLYRRLAEPAAAAPP